MLDDDTIRLSFFMPIVHTAQSVLLLFKQTSCIYICVCVHVCIFIYILHLLYNIY